MNSRPPLERTFPLSGGSEPRPTLRPPRLPVAVPEPPGVVLSNRAFLRAWAERRAPAVAPTRSAGAPVG